VNIEPPSFFFELLGELTRQYKLPELRLFTLEGGKVYITLHNTRYQITAADTESAGQNGLQALEETGTGRRAPVQGAAAAGRADAVSGSKAAGGANTAGGSNTAPLPKNGQQPDGTITTRRFKNLEMDD
jgi:hypothetical protein